MRGVPTAFSPGREDFSLDVFSHSSNMSFALASPVFVAKGLAPLKVRPACQSRALATSGARHVVVAWGLNPTAHQQRKGPATWRMGETLTVGWGGGSLARGLVCAMG
jgi:hypothetical protein